MHESRDNMLLSESCTPLIPLQVCNAISWRTGTAALTCSDVQKWEAGSHHES